MGKKNIIFIFGFFILSVFFILTIPDDPEYIRESSGLADNRIGVPIIPDVPKDAIPPLDFPEYESIDSASSWLSDSDFVLGLEIRGDARAYPIPILNWHEIVNEVIGGEKIVITYCPLCNSGVVFNRILDERELTFGNTGALFESAMVMYDRETESYWYHVAGEAIKGELVGRKLEVVPSNMMRFLEWKEKYPDSQILSRNTGHNRNYDSNPFRGYDELNSRPAFPVSNFDDRLAPKEQVIGIVVDGGSKAYPIRLYAGKTLVDKVGNRNVEVIVNETGDAALVFFVNVFHKELAPTTSAFWFAWSIAYPDTEIYNK